MIAQPGSELPLPMIGIAVVAVPVFLAGSVRRKRVGRVGVALSLVAVALLFAARLREVWRSPVLLAQVEGGLRGFDDARSLRPQAVARRVHQFLEYVHAR